MPSTLDQILGAILPAGASYLTNRALQGQSPFVQAIGSAGAGALTNALSQQFGLPSINTQALTSNSTLTGLPRGLEQFGGAAALIAGLRDQPTVEVPDWASFASPDATASKGFLRSQFEAPDDPFATGGIFDRYNPILTRQEEDLTDRLGQRFANAFPSSVGMQGSAVEATRRLGEEFLQNRQKLIADLTRENQNRQLTAAQGLAGLETVGQVGGFNASMTAAMQAAEAERNRNAQLAQLGLALLLDRGGQGGGGQGGIMGTDGAALPVGGDGNGSGMSSVEQLIGQLLPSPRQQVQISPSQLAQQLGYGLGGAPGSPFVFTTASGQVVPIGIDEATQLAAQGYGSQITSTGGAAGAKVGMDFGVKGASLMGPAGTGSSAAMMSAAGSALAGGYVGYKVGLAIGNKVATPNSSATTAKSALAGGAGGAASGAAVGFMIGGPPGAVVGAIIGGIAGAFGGSGAERRREDANIAHETQLTGSQRPEALATAAQFYQNGEAFESAAKSAQPAILSALEVQASSPQVKALIDQVKAHVQEFGFGFTTGTGVLLDAANPPLDSVLRALVWSGAQGGRYAPSNASNPDSKLGLLHSAEVGKFQPGLDALQQYMRQANAAQALYQQFANLAGV